MTLERLEDAAIRLHDVTQSGARENHAVPPKCITSDWLTPPNCNDTQIPAATAYRNCALRPRSVWDTMPVGR